MKPLLLLAVFSAILISCKSPSFYQEYKVTGFDNASQVDSKLVFEDVNCKISYNFWKEGGDIGFSIFNNTEVLLELDLTKSFFIMNGMARNYYQARTYTTTEGGTVTFSWYFLATATDPKYSVSYTEQPVILVPPQSSILISEYSINKTVYRDCDLPRFPPKSQIKTKSFSAEDSPFVFENFISYRLAETGEERHINNKFYISEITNYPAREYVKVVYDEFCDQKSSTGRRSFIRNNPDKFYNTYLKSIDGKKY